jgi:hypothetical protein
MSGMPRTPRRDLSKIEHVRGRVYDSERRVNAFGVIDRVHLRDYDANTGHVMIRCDHAAMPEFWLEISLSLPQLKAWMREQEEDIAASGEEEEEEEPM